MNIKATLKQYALLIGFAIGIAVGMIWPEFGATLAKPHLGSQGLIQLILIVIIFGLNGMSMKTEDIKSAFSNWHCMIYGFLQILFITPWGGFILVNLDFLQAPFRYGLTIFACVTATVNTTVILTGVAGGNATMNLFITVVCCFISCFTTPMILKLIMASAGNVTVNPLALMWSLAITTLFPLMVGKIIRELFTGPVVRFTTKYKKALHLYSPVALGTIINMNVSASYKQITALTIGEIGMLILVCILYHFLLIAFNGALLYFFSRKRSDGTRFFPIKESKALLFCSIQKAFAIAFTIVPLVASEQVGSVGLLAVPCVIYQAVQSIMDSILAAQLAKIKNDDEVEAEAVAAVVAAIADKVIANEAGEADESVPVKN